MKCKNCNKEIDGNLKVCPFCGEEIIPSEADLEESQEENKEEPLEDKNREIESEDDLSDEEGETYDDDYYDEDEEEIYKDINDLLEELGPPKENKTKKLIATALLAILVTLVAFFGFKKYKDSQIEELNIDLNYYLDISAVGENGDGGLDIKYDKESFINDYEGRIYDKKSKEQVSTARLIDELEKNTSFGVSKEQGLANGELVNITITTNYDKAKDFNIKFTNQARDYQVEGLKEKQGSPSPDENPPAEENKEDDKEKEEDKKEEDKEEEDDKEEKEENNQASDDKKDKFSKYIKDHIGGSELTKVTSHEFMGKAKRSGEEIYVYKINSKENIGDMTKAFDYYIGLIDKENGIELVRDGLIHRSLDDKTDTYYDISYEGFALVDDLLTYLNDGNLKVDGLTYYDNFKAKEEPAGYYFLEGYSLFLDNDKNVKLETGSTVYTGKWSKDNGTLTLDIKSFSKDPIKANIVGGELEFDADVFR